MAKSSLKKDRWTITFDHVLKNRVQEEAKKLRVYPVQLLESMVRERLNPYGFQSVHDSIGYVNSIRGKNPQISDKNLLAELRKWRKK